VGFVSDRPLEYYSLPLLLKHIKKLDDNNYWLGEACGSSYDAWCRASERVEYLETSINNYIDGIEPHTAKLDKCSHGNYGFEGCEQCIEEYFDRVMATPEPKQ
jgi:hypothetical protein